MERHALTYRIFTSFEICIEHQARKKEKNAPSMNIVRGFRCMYHFKTVLLFFPSYSQANVMSLCAFVGMHVKIPFKPFHIPLIRIT